MSYNNLDSMNVYYGQYQGVEICSHLTMDGNMLILDGYGSYRSKSACAYEDLGIDEENEPSNDSRGTIMKIKYCPFCGKELKSSTYELHHAKEKMSDIKDKLTDYKDVLECMFNVVYVESEKIVPVDEFKKNPDDYKHTTVKKLDNCKFVINDELSDINIYNYDDNPNSLYKPTAYKHVENIKCKSQGHSQNKENCTLYYRSGDVRLSDEVLLELIASGKLFTYDDYTGRYSKVTESKFKKFIKNRSKFEDEIKKLTAELEQYKDAVANCKQ